MLLQGLNGFVGQLVTAQSTHGDGIFHTHELPGMIGEVCGCAPQFLTFGKYIP